MFGANGLTVTRPEEKDRTIPDKFPMFDLGSRYFQTKLYWNAGSLGNHCPFGKCSAQAGGIGGPPTVASDLTFGGMILQSDTSGSNSVAKYKVTLAGQGKFGTKTAGVFVNCNQGVMYNIAGCYQGRPSDKLNNYLLCSDSFGNIIQAKTNGQNCVSEGSGSYNSAPIPWDMSNSNTAYTAARGSGTWSSAVGIKNRIALTDVELYEAEFDSFTCSGNKITPGVPARGLYMDQLLSKSDGNPGNLLEITARGMDPAYWDTALSASTSKPSVIVQQLRQARGVLDENPLWSKSTYTSIDAPAQQLSSNAWRTFDGTMTQKNYIYSSAMNNLVSSFGFNNARNAGFMCPIGLYSFQASSSDTTTTAILSTIQGPTTTKDSSGGTASWHKYAQLTMKCPSTKPYRCSYLTMQEVSAGTCEYGFNKKTPFTVSGFEPKPTSTNANPSSDQQRSIDAFISKLYRNSMCNR